MFNIRCYSRAQIAMGVIVTSFATFACGQQANDQVRRLPQTAQQGVNPFARQGQVSEGYNFKIIGDRPLHPSPSAEPSDAVIQLAKVAEQRGDLATAVQAYQDGLTRFPDDRKILINFARLKHRAGDLDGSIATYLHCITQHPDEAIAVNDLGLCYSRKNDLPQAIKYVEAAVRLNPASKRYRNNLATLLVETNELDRAAAILSEVHGPAIGNFNLGYLLSNRQRDSEAIGYLQEALRLDPTLAPAEQLLARVVPRAAATAASQATNTMGTIATQSGILPDAATSAAAVYYEENAGVVQPPEVDAYPIPGMR